jgi:hypothetical protein
MQNRLPARHASWQDLLGSPQRPAHIVQIYESDDFLASGVALFTAEGLRRGEAVLLTGTQAHLSSVRDGLRAHGIDAEAALADRQLTQFDVHEAIAEVVRDGRVCADRFERGVGEALAGAAARHCGVRWWGEISNVLHQQGNTAAALACEDLGNAAIDKYGVTIFCSYRADKFDPDGYEALLPGVCNAHSHVIPAEDYVRHRLAVNRAIHEVVGEIRGPLLQSLMSWRGLACDDGRSQAVLFWLRDSMPDKFDEVLSRARGYA